MLLLFDSKFHFEEVPHSCVSSQSLLHAVKQVEKDFEERSKSSNGRQGMLNCEACLASPEYHPGDGQ